VAGNHFKRPLRRRGNRQHRRRIGRVEGILRPMYQAGNERADAHHASKKIWRWRHPAREFHRHPARPAPVRGTIQGKDLVHTITHPEQYAALTKLTAVLCKIFPKLKCCYPMDRREI